MQCVAVRTWVSEMRVAPQYWPEPLPSLCTCSWLVMTMIATGIIIRFIKIIMITIIFFIIPGRQAMATHQDPQDVLRQFSSGTVLHSFHILVSIMKIIMVMSVIKIIMAVILKMIMLIFVFSFSPHQQFWNRFTFAPHSHDYHAHSDDYDQSMEMGLSENIPILFFRFFRSITVVVD